MARLTGVVESFAALKVVIETALTARGWTLANGVLSKGVAFLRFVATNEALTLAAGTGQANGALTGACPQTVKILRFTNAPIVWPVVYTLHLFDVPDEIYVIVQYNVDRYQHLNFGVSSMPEIGGTGLWCTGTFRGDVRADDAYNRVFLASSGYELGAQPYGGPGLGYWFGARGGSYHSSFIHCGLEGVGWKGIGNGDAGEVLGASHAGGLLHALPSQFNQATVLLPIHALLARQAQGQTIVATLAHARYCRLDSLDLTQPIDYGDDRWWVYPLHALNAAQRNGAAWSIGAQHSGTYGVALRDPGGVA